VARLQWTAMRNQRLSDAVSVRPAQSNHTDPAAARRGCFGDDGIESRKHDDLKPETAKTAETTQKTTRRFLCAFRVLRG